MKNFNKEEIVAAAVASRSRGNTWAQVAHELSQSGYTNSCGKPYSEGGIHTLVSFRHPDIAFRAASNAQPNLFSRSGRAVRTDVVSTELKVVNKPLPKKESAVIELRKSIIDLNGVSAEQKLDLLTRTYEL